MNIHKKTSNKHLKYSSSVGSKSRIRRFLRIPDSGNIIDRQRTFVLFFITSFALLISTAYFVLSFFVKPELLTILLCTVHLVLVLTFVLLYLRRVISLFAAVLSVILLIQVEISFSLLSMLQSPESMTSLRILLINVCFYSLLSIFTIGAYIRYLPYIQTAQLIATLSICAYISKDAELWHVIPILGLAFAMLSVMGDKLMRGMLALQDSRDSLGREQDAILEFMNMNKEQVFQVIRLTHRKSLSDKQKVKLIELLDEHTKAAMLKMAVDVVQKQQQHLSRLDDRELRFTPYEKEVCLLILKGVGNKEIANKLNKSVTAITSCRAVIRQKLALSKEEDLGEALRKLVEREAPDDTPAE